MSLEDIFEAYPEVLVIDGHDDAIVGVGERINLEPVLIYDSEKIITKLAEDMEVEEDELEEGESIESAKYLKALEYFEFNIKGAWVGERTPIFMEKIED
jgi:hypothetical protein